MIIAQETAMLKAKKEFQKIEQAIRQATIEGERIDVVEENLWERMLNLGRLMLTSFVAGQGTGNLGPPCRSIIVRRCSTGKDLIFF